MTKQIITYQDLIKFHDDFCLPYPLLVCWKKGRNYFNGLDLIKQYSVIKETLLFLVGIFITCTLLSIIACWQLGQGSSFMLGFVPTAFIFFVAIILLVRGMRKEDLKSLAADLQALSNEIDLSFFCTPDPQSLVKIVNEKLDMLALNTVNLQNLQKKEGGTSNRESIKSLRESFGRMHAATGKFCDMPQPQSYYDRAEARLRQASSSAR